MDETRSGPRSTLHLPSLGVALSILLGTTIYPPLLAQPDGSADHALAVLLFVAMSAALVRGVGFVPRRAGWRLLFSSWSWAAALALALARALS